MSSGLDVTKSQLYISDKDKKIEELEDSLAKCASQKYCNICGKTLDGYVPGVDKEKSKVSELAAENKRLEKACAHAIEGLHQVKDVLSEQRLYKSVREVCKHIAECESLKGGE